MARGVLQSDQAGPPEPISRCWPTAAAGSPPWSTTSSIFRGSGTIEAMRHLLRNAIRYLRDQPAPRIEVGARRGETAGVESATFYVRDNGIGIDPRYRDQVFDLFERLDPEA